MKMDTQKKSSFVHSLHVLGYFGIEVVTAVPVYEALRALIAAKISDQYIQVLALALTTAIISGLSKLIENKLPEESGLRKLL